jgi:hypothetical protein
MSTQTSWTISKEDWEAALSRPSTFLSSFYEQAVAAEQRYLDEGIRRALGLWVSELEPELMFTMGQTRPFGVTAKGHGVPYIEIRWDENYYPTSDPIRYPISYARGVFK